MVASLSSTKTLKIIRAKLLPIHLQSFSVFYIKVWAETRKYGLKSATVFWPGSEVPGIQPDWFLHYDDSITDKQRLQMAQNHLVYHKYDLVFAYLATLDEVGHRHGPDSPQMDQALSKLDRQLTTFVRKLWRKMSERLNVLIVSDHGMAKIEHRIHLETLLPGWTRRVFWVDCGPVVSLIPNSDEDWQCMVDEINQNTKGMPVKAYLADDLPARFHYWGNARIPPIVIITAVVLLDLTIIIHNFCFLICIGMGRGKEQGL